MVARIFKILTVFLPNKCCNRKNNPIPIIPPNVFPIKSVISLPPIAKIYCMISYIKLTQKIGMAFFIKFHFPFNIDKYTPNGINATIFKMISDVSTLPFTTNEPAKGIRLILLKFIFLRSEISNCILNSIIQDRTIKYTTNKIPVNFFILFSCAIFIVVTFLSVKNIEIIIAIIKPDNNKKLNYFLTFSAVPANCCSVDFLLADYLCSSR